MKTVQVLIQLGLLCLLGILQIGQVKATECGITQNSNQGYSTTITSVIDNGDDTHTIVLTVANNGCAGCKKLNRYIVQAQPGTYSGISVLSVQGNVTFANIHNGPNCGGPFQGFRINIANGIGNGNAAAFTITYTLTGGLQNQLIQSKASNFFQNYNFSIADFQSVLDCQTPEDEALIVPYYDPLGVGKVFDIIGYELRALYFSYQENDFVAAEVDDIFQIVGESVLISLLVQPGEYDNVLPTLSSPAYGLASTVGDPSNNTITGLYPIANLLLLNELPQLLISAGPIFPALGNAGLVTSQGDIALRSFRARDVFKVNGQGIKIGVISDSYNTKLGNQAGDDIIRRDLPGPANPDNTAPIDLVLEYPYGEASDEGRAMLQIVHDIAPGAELAFRTGFTGPNDFAVGINQLQQAGCDIIVDDVTYINEPFFRDGVVAQAVDNVTAEGVAYFTAAGNFGTSSWQEDFNPVPAPAGVIGEAHNFAGVGSVDISQNITLSAGQYTVVMQWDDGTPGLTTHSDFDIYLATNSGIAFFGFNRANIGSTPIEVLPFTVLADGVQSNFQIIRAGVAPDFTPSQPTTLKYIVFRGSLEINEYTELDRSTIMGQANAEGAMAVGAVLYTNTPEYGVAAPTVASFSSRGGTPVNGVLRNKPEFCAPNVVNTSVDLGGGFDFEGDGFPNFIGTSAAAPHAAGMAALVLEARQKFYDDEGNLSPEELKLLLQNSALDMYGPGYDVESGAGFLLADSALNTLANPTAFLITVTYDTTLVPGIDEIPIVISGEYLNAESQVYFNGVFLETISTLQGDTAITAIIPPFQDILFPEIQVFNPSQPGTNGLDGGLSNPVYLTTKTTIFVDIQDTVKIYGETIPQFSAGYFLGTLDGNLPIDSAGLTQEELARILGINIITVANSLSNVGLWGIEPDDSDPLNPLSDVEATDAMDVSLLERFNFVFSNGLMTINPLDLIIDTRDTTLIYNDSLVGFDFDYLFNQNNSLNISEGDKDIIINGLRLVHATALVNKGAVLVRATALVNDISDPFTTEELLANKSFMISSAVRLVRATALVNGELIEPQSFYEAAAFTNATARLVRATALVNGFRLVRATALVNTVGEDGELLETIPLTNSSSLLNSSGELSTTTFTANSNSQTIVILGEGDIAILSGDSIGVVETESINLVTGETVGTHFILPGAFLSNNFNVSYLSGSLIVLPDEATFEFDIESLTQVYDGSAKQVIVSAVPDTVAYAITYNGEETLPIDAGSYLVEVVVTDSNYTGSATATLTILPAEAVVNIDLASTTQVYDGSGKSVLVTTDPQGLAAAITYDGSSDLPVNAGTYAVDVVITNPNYTGSVSGLLTIDKATAGIEITDLNQTYDGSAKSVSVSTTPSELTVSVSYNNSEDLPVNAGSYEVQVVVVDDNYEGLALATLGIEKAEASISLLELSQIYDGNPKPISGTTSPAGLTLLFAYEGLPDAPVNAGSYSVQATVVDSNYMGSSVGILVIDPGQAQLLFTDLIQEYDGNPKEVTVISTPSVLIVEVTYNGSTDLPVNAGDYNVDAIVFDNNYMGSGIATLVISPKEVIINTGVYGINEGSELPVFESTFDGFVNGDDAGVISDFFYELSPTYTGEAGVYEIIPNATAVNYSFVAGDGTLYVNPTGPGTQMILPYFECFQYFEQPDENGFNYLALFYYENNNPTDVYIPKGSSNALLNAERDDTNQPEVFLSGGGSFSIPYDGELLRWLLRSNIENGGSRFRFATAWWFLECEEASKNNARAKLNAEESVLETVLFPNPSSGKVFIQVTGTGDTWNNLEVYDSVGKKHSIPAPHSSGMISEVDLSNLSPGLYIIRVSSNSWSRAMNVIIE